MKHAFDIYSEQILSFKLNGQELAESSLETCDISSTAKKHLCFAEKGNTSALILFGAADGKLAREIHSLKPEELTFIICDLFPESVRDIQQHELNFIEKSTNTHLIVDSSVWAHLQLLIQYGFSPKNSHLVLNPCLQGKSKKKHQNLQKLISGCKNFELTLKANNKLKISAGAILSPDEPDIDSFISSFPKLFTELVLVWDCSSPEEIPRISCDSDLKIVNICHPLNNNFAAQRNIMLENCSGDWIFYLDADERFPAEQWDQLKTIASHDACDGWYFPRMTLYPDSEHCRIGYGLWPDLQLRFFRKSASVIFVNRIHERLTGLKGQTGLLAGTPIRHLTHLLKNREEIESKLSSFNQATSGKFKHILGSEFPCVTSSLLEPQKNIPLTPVILSKIVLEK